MNPPEPGWYRDPYFKNRERYWDGEMWTDECRLIQPALPSGQPRGAAAPGAEPMGRHVVRTDPVTAQQPAVAKDPVPPQQPAAAPTPSPGDTQPIRISSGTVAGAGVGAFFGANGPARGAGGWTPSGGIAGASPAAGSAGSAGGPAKAEATEAKATAAGTTEAGTAKAEATAARATTAGAEAESVTDTASTPATKAEAAANAERVRTVGAAAILGGDIPGDTSTTYVPPPPTRSVKTPKEPPPDATRRVIQEADPLLGVSMPGTNSAETTATTAAIEAKTTKSHRRGLIAAVVAVVVVLAGLGAFVALDHKSTKGGGHGHGGGAGHGGSKNAVSAAASATLHKKTAAIAIDVKVSSTALGQTQGPNGNGDFNLAKEQGSMTLTVPGLPASAQQQQLVFDKKTVYVNIGSSLSTVMPGKTWISGTVLDVSSSTQGIGTTLSSFEQMVGNPAGLIHQLKGNSSTVVSLGASTFDGVPVQGYTVTLSSKVLNNTADLVPRSHATETVYVADGLIKAIVIPTTMSAGGQLLHENTYVVYSNYGAPVTVTLPPADQTVTIAQYRAAAGTTPTTAPPASSSAAESPGSG